MPVTDASTHVTLQLLLACVECHKQALCNTVLKHSLIYKISVNNWVPH